ncbi:hypothetical protein BRARA_I04177 [Brassica rapa]|uniref:PHD-type zinc finger plants domain-containing protein n=3 Tax=Brassica TaxID=3705 RepID=A0ABQ8C660_BRANA|nr:uncharacterized protein LOC103841900 [Brassica rapa]XP_013709959.2 uncharacterized protein LOC106413762 [Brassica napus]KAG5386454.1 hypothetical protein IGI04_037924 [Brassica rapa subsp. trilocularis]KAH0912468.1 hypothetical protein HID58_035789 [Brassica napus]RID47595.1 hypothetical protein BRARA_I04177 [Brassica rapa]CAG7866068.1 unnamed protein product [Brassica rapa]VDC63095.1 unnamed protein product [Brassica rapa]
MVDLERKVCCMCGDVGFFDKLFHCSKCLNRFQHSYCSSYYKEQGDPIKICDWCQFEAKSRTGAKHGVSVGSSKRSYRSEYSSANQIKNQEINQITASSSIPPVADKGKTSVPSPRTATRRYKLLKDVMC